MTAPRPIQKHTDSFKIEMRHATLILLSEALACQTIAASPSRVGSAAPAPVGDARMCRIYPFNTERRGVLTG